MIRPNSSPTDSSVRVGGFSLIAAAIGFTAIFMYLAARFNYPAVLDGSAADVLPKLLSLGTIGRGVWAAYALLPLLLIPAGIGAYVALRDSAPGAMKAALIFSVLAAVSMLLGLARWPSIQWELGKAYATAGPESRAAIDAVFSGLNAYLGNLIGEFLGELSLNAFFLLVAFAMLRSGRRYAGYAGMVAGLVGLIAAFRNVTQAVEMVANVNNTLLPVWLTALGILLVRTRRVGSASIPEVA
jgi:hypothetical protein